MDYIWARLPIISTEGDSIAKLVKEENVGEVVKYENTHQLARVIESVLTNKSLKDIYKKNLEKLAPSFYWENVTKPLVEYCLQPQFAPDKKKIFDLIDLQNNKIVNVIKSNLSGATNVLVLSTNPYYDKELLKDLEIGKLFLVDVGDNTAELRSGEGVPDKVGYLKSKIVTRTRFDGVIINNTFENIAPKFLYDLLNVIGMKLKVDGIIFFSVPEDRGILKIFTGEQKVGSTADKIDEFTFEYLLQNTGYEIISKGIWDKLETDPDKIQNLNQKNQSVINELYSKNELTDLFEIKLSREDFKDLSLLKGLNILESDEFKTDKSIGGKIKKYLYAVTSLYLENLRKSYNASIQSVNNNIQVQINREINELNAKNRERMLFIYYSIFKTLQYQISNLGVDMRAMRKLFEDKFAKSENEVTALDEKLEVLLGDIENIDKIMGLTLSNKYYIAKKL
jgi:hypothetical protein